MDSSPLAVWMNVLLPDPVTPITAMNIHGASSIVELLRDIVSRITCEESCNDTIMLRIRVEMLCAVTTAKADSDGRDTQDSRDSPAFGSRRLCFRCAAPTYRPPDSCGRISAGNGHWRGRMGQESSDGGAETRRGAKPASSLVRCPGQVSQTPRDLGSTASLCRALPT